MVAEGRGQGVVGKEGLPHPRGEFDDARCGMGADALEHVDAVVRAEAGEGFEIRDGPRRAADPPVLVADTARLRSELQWSPRHGGLRAIVRSALAWEGARAGGARGQPAAGSV